MIILEIMNCRFSFDGKELTHSYIDSDIRYELANHIIKHLSLPLSQLQTYLPLRVSIENMLNKEYGEKYYKIVSVVGDTFTGEKGSDVVY